MSSVALAPTAVSRPAINPWFVAVAVVVPTFMEVLDTTIANVALRYIAGGLSASNVDSEWVITSYLAANATILPISGWLSAHLGRRNYFLLSIAVFTIASGLCGMATSLEQIDPVPGDPGPGRRRTPALQPGRPARHLPAREAGRGPDDVRRRGPARAGRRPDAGRLSHGQLRLALDLLHQPPGGRPRLPGVATSWSRTRITSRRSGPSCVASRSISTTSAWGCSSLVMSCWEVMLSKGQEWDWYNDPFWRVQTLFILFVARAGRPDRPGAADRQPGGQLPAAGRAQLRGLAASSSSVPTACSTAPARRCRACSSRCSATTPTSRGWCSRPRASSPSWCCWSSALCIGRGVDARWLIAAGLLVMAAGNYWMALMNLYISPWQVVWPRVVMISACR